MSELPMLLLKAVRANLGSIWGGTHDFTYPAQGWIERPASSREGYHFWALSAEEIRAMQKRKHFSAAASWLLNAERVLVAAAPPAVVWPGTRPSAVLVDRCEVLFTGPVGDAIQFALNRDGDGARLPTRSPITTTDEDACLHGRPSTERVKE
ncbi:MAG: hypothetical protein SFX73_38545 [Kofleriaceae bacterium]|nr:hypothetical protein [Kofleriaceae bacterium]